MASYNIPTIYAHVTDINTETTKLTGDSNVLVKYFSYAYASMTAVAYGGASINEDMYIIRNGDYTIYGKSGTISGVEDNNFIFSAEDSAGRIGVALYSAAMIDYTLLTCVPGENKVDGSGAATVSCSGAFFNASFGAKYNSITAAKYRYRVDGGSWSGWYTMSTSLNGNAYYAYASLSGLDYRKTYYFEYQVSDALMTASAQSNAVRSLPVFHWGENDVVFEVPVTFKGGATDETKTEVETEYDTWSPSLDSDAVNYYERCDGWYYKVGNIVTVGFFIKAQCNTYDNFIPINIYGLPYIPLASAAGGGMCSGAWMAAEHNFQCFVAESSGIITTRSQECNAETDAHSYLDTSAQGCLYPPATHQLTLSGTITYMI